MSKQDGNANLVKPKRRRGRPKTTKKASFQSPVTSLTGSVDSSSVEMVVESDTRTRAPKDVVIEVVEDNVYVGFDDSEQLWYGWRNNLVPRGFGIGDRLHDALGLPEGFVAGNLDQARKLAVNYARNF